MWELAGGTEKSTYTVPEGQRGREAEAKTQRWSNREEEEHQKRETKESLLHRCGPICLYSNVCKAIFICIHLYSRHLHVSFPGTMNSRVAWQFGMAIPFSYVWWGRYLVRDVLAEQAEVSTWGQQDRTEWASYGLLENPEGTQVKMVGIESAQSRDKGKTMLATVLFLKNQYLNYKHDYHSWFEWILSTPPQPPQSSYIGTVIPLCDSVGQRSTVRGV